VEIDGPREKVTDIAKWLPRSGFAAHAQPVRYDRRLRGFVSSGA
jgi:hypothetical protein